MAHKVLAYEITEQLVEKVTMLRYNAVVKDITFLDSTLAASGDIDRMIYSCHL